MLERTRKTFKLKPNEKCPGETFCTTNIAGKIFENGETLETFCKPNRCELFYTKAGTTPAQFEGLLQSANMLRSRHKRGLRLFENDLPFVFVKAYEVAESIYDLVDAEISSKDPDDEANSLDIMAGGDTNTFDAIVDQLKSFEDETANDENGEQSEDSFYLISRDI